VKVDIRDTSGPVLGAPSPAAPVYSTKTLNQPLDQAAVAADGIIKHNLVR